jgi:hypothetical protein
MRTVGGLLTRSTSPTSRAASSLTRGPCKQKRAADGAATLKRASERRELRELAARPLLLTLMARLQTRGGGALLSQTVDFGLLFGLPLRFDQGRAVNGKRHLEANQSIGDIGWKLHDGAVRVLAADTIGHGAFVGTLRQIDLDGFHATS